MCCCLSTCQAACQSWGRRACYKPSRGLAEPYLSFADMKMSVQAILILASQQVLLHRDWSLWKNGLWLKLSFSISLWRKHSWEFPWPALLSWSNRQIFFPRSPLDIETCTALCTQICLLSELNILFLRCHFHGIGSEGYPLNSEVTKTAGFSSVRGLGTAVNDVLISLSYTSNHSKLVWARECNWTLMMEGSSEEMDKSSELKEYCKEWASGIRASWSYLSVRRAW